MSMDTGVPDFTNLSLAFAYGKDSQALKENRVAGVQVRSGGRVRHVVQPLM